MGAPLGPWGAAAGSVLGAGIGYFGYDAATSMLNMPSDDATARYAAAGQDRYAINRGNAPYDPIRGIFPADNTPISGIITAPQRGDLPFTQPALGGSGSAMTTQRRSGALPAAQVPTAMQGEFIPRSERVTDPGQRNPIGIDQMLQERQTAMNIAYNPSPMPAGQRRAAREALQRLDEQLFGTTDRERKAALDFGGIGIDQQEADTRQGSALFDQAKGQEAARQGAQGLMLRAQELGVDQDRLNLEFRNAAAGERSQTLIDIFDKAGSTVSTVLELEGPEFREQQIGIANTLAGLLRETALASNPQYQALVQQFQAGDIDPEDAMKIFAKVHDNAKEAGLIDQPIQGYAEGGLVQPAIPGQQPAMPQEAQMRQLYMQYAQGAEQRGIPAVPFGTFIELATPQQPSQPYGAMGFAEGGLVPSTLRFAEGGMIPGFEDGGGVAAGGAPTAGATPGGAMPTNDASGRMVIDADPNAQTDSIPAIIDGRIPAALDSGEFVIPEDVVRFVGVQKLQKLIEQAKSSMNQEPSNGRATGAASALG